MTCFILAALHVRVLGGDSFLHLENRNNATFNWEAARENRSETQHI